MEQKTLPDFIVLDDDAVNNLICEKIIQTTFPGAIVQTFTEPEMGLEHILATYAEGNSHNAILFLDINMPSLNGWEVLDKLDEFPDVVKGHVKIFMLSSSVDPLDTEKARDNPLVSGYIMKSLSQTKLQAVFTGNPKQNL
jgi:CheY-like chemotaxis protein